ncbi:MAG: ATP-dependent helicase [Clostridia bacterium]|nr:ATP-dependent helicase [Clostridia bacterium]
MAIEHLDGPMQVLAGPGSGKTFVIIERLMYLIKERQIPPEHILVITFTNAAAQEMKTRFEKRCSHQFYPVFFGTFHSVFYHILKQHPIYNSCTLMKYSEKIYMVEMIAEAMMKENSYDFTISGEWKHEFLKLVSLKKNMVCSEQMNDPFFISLYKNYTEQCLANHKIDFDDMLNLCYEILKENQALLLECKERFRYILIDEFQDINDIQFHIIRMLTKNHENVFVVGDDDQSIYSFRGSMPDIMLNFAVYYPQAKQIILEENYRSAANIVSHAKCLISHNTIRYQKEYHAVKQLTGKIVVKHTSTIQKEAKELMHEIISQKLNHPQAKIAVIYRTTRHTPSLLKELYEHHIEFICKDHIQSIYQTDTASDLITYFKLCSCHKKRVDLIKIMNKPKRYLSRKSMSKEEVSFEEILLYYHHKPYMMPIIKKLKYDLDRMSELDSYGALKYLLKCIGYEKYLKESLANAGKSKDQIEETWSIVEHFKELAGTYQRIDELLNYIEACQRMEEGVSKYKNRTETSDEHDPPILLSTLHGIKGMEFDIVYIIHVNQGEIPHKKAKTCMELEEERRLFYVGITRAKEELHLFYVDELFGKPALPSNFLKELLK